MRKLRSITFVFLLVVSAGCDSAGALEGGKVEMTTDKVDYKIGDMVIATISNESGETVTFGACFDSIDGLVDGEWVPAVRFDVCTLQIISLESGKEHEFEVLLSDVPPASLYRLSYTVSVRDDSELISSNLFKVSE